MSTNSKTAIGILTMAGPIVLLGAICSITTMWYALPQIHAYHHEGGVVTPICMSTYYVHLVNGVCSRGKVDNIDVEKSCLQWTDKSAWEALDAKNKEAYAAGHLNYHRSNTVDEVQNVWLPIKALTVSTIPLSLINFAACLTVADVQLEYWNIDFDVVVLVTSAVLNGYILSAFLAALLLSKDADLLNKNTWRTEDCGSTSAPSFAYFLTILGGAFALLGFYVAVHSLLLIYVFPNKMGKGIFDGMESTLRDLDEAIPEGENEDEEDEEGEEDSVEGPSGGSGKDEEKVTEKHGGQQQPPGEKSPASPISPGPITKHNLKPVKPPANIRANQVAAIETVTLANSANNKSSEENRSGSGGSKSRPISSASSSVAPAPIVESGNFNAVMPSQPPPQAGDKPARRGKRLSVV